MAIGRFDELLYELGGRRLLVGLECLRRPHHLLLHVSALQQ
jgi:hypothetical protein